jgi:NitT/TauT family transport system ATP-binding protein
LLPWRTVRENALLLTQVGRGHADHPTLDRAGIVDLLTEVGLGGFLDAFPRELSGGMQQRVALVRAFALAAPILLLDEPFAALDEITRSDMRYLLLRLWQRTGVTALFVTHSIAEAIALSDRVAVMAPRPGRIVTVEEVGLARPRTADMEDTAAFHTLEARLRRVLQTAMAEEAA